MPPSQSVALAIVIADSGVKSSGAGNNWSDWYQLGTGKAPQGTPLRKRSCGSPDIVSAANSLNADKYKGVISRCLGVSIAGK